MTNHWNDIANADCMLALGSNPCENHPAAIAHIMTAKERGAKLISIDPRFTRTSARADMYAPIRSGTDVALVNGMISWVITDIEANPQNYNIVYITEYTNAAYLVNTSFKLPADLDGLFSGYNGGSNETDNAKRSYNKATWTYQLDENGRAKKDKTLKDPNCVFQLLKRHVSRYTPDKVSAITGMPKDLFLEITRIFAATGKADKAGVILYAMGTTQHTNGTQNIRAYGILQMLLANMGVAGGGIAAMRGESNVQGSTDYGLLFGNLPGYLTTFSDTDSNVQAWATRTLPTTKEPQSANWMQNYTKYIVSMLKAWYGDAANKDNEFGMHYLPKIQTGKNYSWIPMFEAMEAGSIKGMMAWGMNPAVGGPNSDAQRKALGKLDWLVAVDLWKTETAEFWHRPGVNPSDIKTEIFMLPAKASFEKEGSVSNSGRWMQWRYKAAEGAGESEDDLWMINKLMLKLKDLYAKDSGPNAEAITKLTVNYSDPADPHKVAKEINGYFLEDKTIGTVTYKKGTLLTSFANLQTDGTTSSGCWIYCGSYIDEDPIKGNLAARRDPTPDLYNIGLHSKWSWSWPVNRRIIYNRAAVDLKGEPFAPLKPVVWWKNGAWTGDVIDGNYPPLAVDATASRLPFIMTNDGVARMFGPGLTDGPFPEFYEPWESPASNQMSKQQNNPSFRIWRPQERGTTDRFPIIGTTYRVCEHWQTGGMTRNLSWCVEAMPEPFVEMSEELAAEKGIKNSEYVIVESMRGQVKMKALVTKRFKPFNIGGKTVHEVGVLWHWGYASPSKGDSANILTPYAGDANTMIPEYKAFLVNVKKA
jgi:formate dehydrogenase-N alpha subunit